MDIFAYVQALLDAATPMAYFCLGILAFFALSVLWELLHGIRRGFARQLTHTIFMIGSAALAFFLTSSFVTSVFGELGGMSIEEILATAESSGTEISEEIRNIIASFDAETLQYLLALPISTVVAPIIFAVLFCLINLVSKLISFIVCKIFRIQKGRGFLRRIGGLAVGVVEGALVASILILPISGITSSVDGAMAVIREDAPDSELVAMYDEVMAPLAECPLFSLINSIGGDALLGSLATVNIGGEPEDLRGELSHGIKIYAEAMKLSGADFKQLSVGDKSAIDAFLDALGGSDYIMTVASGLLRGLANSADNGYITIQAEPPFDKLISSLIGVFESSNKNNLGGDLNTLKEVIFILSDEGVLTAMSSEDDSALTDALTKKDSEGNTVVRRIIVILGENEHTQPLVATLTEISVAMLCENMGLDGDTAELYDNVKEGVREVLTIRSEDYANDDEYVEAISESLNATLAANDINLEPEIVDSMANYIKDNHKDLENISDEEINDVILSYYDSYLEYIKNNPDGAGGNDGNGDGAGGGFGDTGTPDDSNIDDDGTV